MYDNACFNYNWLSAPPTDISEDPMSLLLQDGNFQPYCHSPCRDTCMTVLFCATPWTYICNDDGGAYTPDNPPMTGCGMAGANGKLHIQITRGTPGVAVTNARVANSCATGEITRKIGVRFRDPEPQTLVGFLHYLQFVDPYASPDVELYLQRVCNYLSLHYTRLDSSLSALNDCSVVFVVLPKQDLTSQQITALTAFGNTFGRRLVLVGEHSDQAAHNGRLNSLLDALGVQATFSTSSSRDGWTCYTQTCEINEENEIMSGVNGLWYRDTGVFADVGPSTNELAYGATTGLSGAWIIEEPTGGGGSVVGIHDSNFFGWDNNFLLDIGRDTVPDKNFQFTCNLCVTFPQ